MDVIIGNSYGHILRYSSYLVVTKRPPTQKGSMGKKPNWRWITLSIIDVLFLLDCEQ